MHVCTMCIMIATVIVIGTENGIVTLIAPVIV